MGAKMCNSPSTLDEKPEKNRTMLTMRSWLSLILTALLMTLLAACAPAATPTPTPVPATEAAETEEPDETEATSVPETEEATETPEATEAENERAESTAPAGAGLAATITTSAGRVREAPARTATTLVELPEGAAITVLGRTPDGGYALVETEDGVQGWLAFNSMALEDRFADVPLATPAS
jgi:glucose/arabinose dehydrogenase